MEGQSLKTWKEIGTPVFYRSADERVYYPVDVEPYTPAHHFEKGEKDPQFRTKLKLAVDLVRRAVQAHLPFRAVVADSFYGEDRGVKGGLKELGVGYVQAMQQVQQEYGSFAKYLQAVKAKGEEALLKDLRQRFAFLGESTSIMFLFGVGEEMPQTLQKMQEMHKTTH